VPAALLGRRCACGVPPPGRVINLVQQLERCGCPWCSRPAAAAAAGKSGIFEAVLSTNLSHPNIVHTYQYAFRPVTVRWPDPLPPPPSPYAPVCARPAGGWVGRRARRAAGRPILKEGRRKGSALRAAGGACQPR
jgi:hypothetical protein